MLKINYATQKQLSKVIKYYNKWEINPVEIVVIVNNEYHMNLTYKEWRSVIKGYDYGICVKFDVKDEENINQFMDFYEDGWEWKNSIHEQISEIGFAPICEWADIDWFIDEGYKVMDFDEWKSIVERGE